MRTACRRCAVLTFFVLAVASRAQQLALRHYDVNDGLAHSRINCVFQDREGYLWFGTWEGLSRFDGYSFVNYGPQDGLPNAFISAIAEDSKGRIWVGTMNGIARLTDEAQSGRGATKFRTWRVGTSVDGNTIDRLAIDRTDRVWCLTLGGLYCGTVGADGVPRFTPVALLNHRLRDEGVLLVDRRGNVWAGIEDELLRVAPGRVTSLGMAPNADGSADMNIVETATGHLIVSCGAAVYSISPARQPPAAWTPLPAALPAAQTVAAMAVAPDDSLWIGTNDGLVRWREGQRSVYTAANGLTDAAVLALYTDRDANLWIGTSSGVAKLSSEPIVSYTTTEGLPEPFITRVIESHDGRIYASTAARGIVEITGGKAVVVPGSNRPPFDRAGKRILQDRRGDWWIGTSGGLYRFTGPALQFSHGRKFGARDGIPERPLYLGYTIREAPDGTIWASVADGNVYSTSPAAASGEGPIFRHVALNAFDATMNRPLEGVIALGGDRTGTLWASAFTGFLARMRDGAFVPLHASAGLPELAARSFLTDRRGRFWIGLRNGGVSYTDSQEPPFRFTNLSMNDGLASNTVWSLAEDNEGRIYLGTGRGVDQLDPLSGHIRHLNRDDGLAGNLINDCMRDHRGNIWIATNAGVSEYVPPPRNAGKVVAPIYFSSIEAGERRVPLPERGATHPAPLTLSSSRSNVVINYVALNFRTPQEIRYQYKLDGTDREWSAPASQRTVNYAHLAAGTYRFLVRAVSADGMTSTRPAELSVVILRPVWQRWWFLTILAAALLSTAFRVYDFRMRHLLAMERLRTQIATDLHDDIGPALSQVAILSEVLKRQTVSAAEGQLEEIASLARSMRESMSEIVWSVDPRKDRLSELVQRMKQVTWNLFARDDLEVTFDAPDERDLERIALAPDERRHLLLIFKEAVNNVLQHASATRVVVGLRVDGAALHVLISDDGRGFDALQEHEGTGLRSLRRRASAIGATLNIESSPAGTRIAISVPASRR